MKDDSRTVIRSFARLAALVAALGFSGVPATAAPQCKAIAPVLRIDCKQHDQASCEKANCCWSGTQEIGAQGQVYPWCYRADQQKPDPGQQNPACQPIDPLERVDCGNRDMQGCIAAGCCFSATSVRGWRQAILPSCFKPGQKTVHCPATTVPSCHGDVAAGTGQMLSVEDYIYKGAKCQREACKDRPKPTGNPASCKPLAGKDRRDCGKGEAASCNAAGCCWTPTNDQNPQGQVYPWCYKP